MLSYSLNIWGLNQGSEGAVTCLRSYRHIRAEMLAVSLTSKMGWTHSNQPGRVTLRENDIASCFLDWVIFTLAILFGISFTYIYIYVKSLGFYIYLIFTKLNLKVELNGTIRWARAVQQGVFEFKKKREKVWQIVSWHQQDPIKNIKSILMKVVPMGNQEAIRQRAQGSLMAGNKETGTHWKWRKASKPMVEIKD